MTTATPTTPPLRPLGLGEIFDRAVTLCVTHVIPFALIYVVYAIPFGVIGFFASHRTALMVGAIMETLSSRISGKPDPPALNSQMFTGASPSDLLWSLALYVFFLFVGPLFQAALIDATTETYAGRSASFARAYRIGVSRWLPMIGVNMLFLVAGIALYIAVALVVVVIALAVAALSAAVHALGIAVGVIIGIVAVVALVLFVLIGLLMVQMAYFACVVEKAGPVTAFGRGVGRIANRIGFRRAVIVGLAYFAVSIGIGIVATLGQGTLIGLLHSPVLGAVFSTVVGFVTAAFLTALMTIFYFDLRVREEGLDLELAARATLAPLVEGA